VHGLRPSADPHTNPHVALDDDRPLTAFAPLGFGDSSVALPKLQVLAVKRSQCAFLGFILVGADRPTRARWAREVQGYPQRANP
jgi:hypothetical protein